MYFYCISISFLCSQITLIFKTIYLNDSKYIALNLTHQIRLFHKSICHLNMFKLIIYCQFKIKTFNTLDMTLKIQIFQGYVELVIHPLRQDLKRVKINSKQCRILFFIVPYRFFIPKQNKLVSLKQRLSALSTFIDKAQNGRLQVNFDSFFKIALLVCY